MADSPVKPEPSVAGKTTVDAQMVFEPERLSYQSADHVAQKVADEVAKSVHGETIVIVGTILLADFANLRATIVMLENLVRDYDALATLTEDLRRRRGETTEEIAEPSILSEGAATAASTALSPVLEIAGAAFGVMQLLSNEVEYQGVKTTVDELAFELALAAKLKAKGAGRVVVPDLMLFQLTEPREGSIRFFLQQVTEAKTRAWAVFGPLMSLLMSLEVDLEQATTANDQMRAADLSSRIAMLRRDMQPVSGPIAQCDQRLVALQRQWEQVAPGSTLTQLARMLRAEAIASQSTLFLHAQIVSSGGHNRVSRSLLRSIFMGDGLSFAGGATARWALLESDGSIRDGGIATSRYTSSPSYWSRDRVKGS